MVAEVSLRPAGQFRLTESTKLLADEAQRQASRTAAPSIPQSKAVHPIFGHAALDFEHSKLWQPDYPSREILQN
jgi:hypothetical protein